MLKPALAALAFAAMAAISGSAQAHDTNTDRYGVFGAPFFYDFAHRGDDRYDRGDRQRHVHFRNGKRLVHEHKFKKRSHKHGKGWGEARFPRDGWKRHSDRRDHWRWRHDRRHDHDGDRHSHRREAQRHGAHRHDHDARDHNHRRDAQRHDGRDRDWRESRRDDDRRWRDRRWNNDN